MGLVLSVLNEKGGVGKTTINYNFGWVLSRKYKVLMIDMDGQNANLTFLAGCKLQEDQKTMKEVLCRNVSIKDVAVKIKENLYLVPATVDVVDITQTTAKVRRMRQVLSEAKEDYDFVFIDVGPNPDWRHYLTLAVIDYAAIVMLPDVMSLESNRGIFESICEVKDDCNPNLRVLGMFFNRNEDRTNLSREVKQIAEQMASKYNCKLLTEGIRQSTKLGESAGKHVGITEYAKMEDCARDTVKVLNALLKEVKN